MKKSLLVLGLALGIAFGAQAGKYKLDEAQLDEAFAKSTEVSFNDVYASGTALDLNTTKMGAASTKTRGGYLLRSFFCGSFAIHRYYMGTTKKAMWALYFCVPVAGGVAACVDFWGAVFVADWYKDYEDNDKWFVWID